MAHTLHQDTRAYITDICYREVIENAQEEPQNITDEELVRYCIEEVIDNIKHTISKHIENHTIELPFESTEHERAYEGSIMYMKDMIDDMSMSGLKEIEEYVKEEIELLKRESKA